MGGVASHSQGTGAVTLQPSGSAAEPRLRSAPGLIPPLHALQRRGSSCHKPQAGAAGPAGSLPGSEEQDRAGGQDPSSPAPPRLSPFHVGAGGEWIPTAARPALTPAGAPASFGVRPSRRSRGAAASRHGPRDSPFPAAWLQRFLPFPRRGTRDATSRGTFCGFLPCRVCGENRRERRLRSRVTLSPAPEHRIPEQAGLRGHSLRSGAHPYGTAPGRRQLPACGQHLCGHEGPRKVPSAGRGQPRH